MQAKFTQISSDVLDKIANGLSVKGYVVLDDVFDVNLIDALEQHVRSLEAEQFHAAGIGRHVDFHVTETIRRDHICWLDSGKTPVETAFLTNMALLQQTINQQLFLGLFDYEAHFAKYSAGGFYKKHLDAFHGLSNRVLSTVLYLNSVWKSEDGGELILFDEKNTDQEIEHVLPKKGRFLVFLSECFYHKVNKANKTRYSIAGWFRVNNSLLSSIDPAR